LTAIRHKEPDYVPVSPRVWAWIKEYYGSSRWPWVLRAAAEFDFDPFVYVASPYPNYIDPSSSGYQHVSYVNPEGHDLEYLHDVEADLRIERLPDHTLISRRIKTPAGTLTDCVKKYKGGIGFGIDPYPQWVEHLVKDARDLEALAFLLPSPGPGDYRDIVALQDEIGERGLLHLDINSAIDFSSGWVMSTEDLMVATVLQPEFVHDLLRLFQDHTIAECRAALEAGVKIIFTPYYFASQSAGWSPIFYRDFILPLVREQAEIIHRAGGIFHYYDDGKVKQILSWVAEAGVDILSTLPPPPIGDVDLSEAKSLVGDVICLNGNIDIVNVVKEGAPELVKEKVREAILAGAPGGGFILGTSDSIREAPIANVRAYFTSARQYGNYAHLGSR
jgi:hypothetical protein